MADIKFKLEKDEISRQIHYILGELYPDLKISSDAIRDLVVETAPDGAGVKFDAAAFAEHAGIDKNELTADLFKELGVEYEKNWHDKLFFGIKMIGGIIDFNVLDRETDA
ncbi:MAG TPA: hypothetical protein ENH25_06335 [candidate division Zixibacteria bacterium]|nr:hypothetical protein [candidate division Zixibacteria bacterium]